MDITSQPTGTMKDGSLRSRRGMCRTTDGLTIAAIVVAFIVAWPLGLAALAWVIWRQEIKNSSLMQKLRRTQLPEAPSLPRFMGRKPTNTSLAAYLDREQQRLRDEQKKLNELVEQFEAFKEAERVARDRQDFEAFLKQQESQLKDSRNQPVPGVS